MGLFTELKRRHVFRVAGGYLLVAWLVLQVTDVLISLLELPGWIGRLAFLILLTGFPLAILASWIFEITPEGVKRESAIGATDIRPTSTGRAIDFVIIVALTAVVAYLIWGRIQPSVLEPDSAEQSVAVLPVRSVTGDESGEFFAAGLHDILLAELAKIPDLKVISRRSVLPYADSAKSIQEIASELDVRHVVEASVQSSGGQLRVVAQLIEADTEDYLWAESYNEAIEFERFFEVQAAIVARIGDSLETTLLPDAAATALRAATSSEEAYRDYVRAMSLIDDPDRSSRPATQLLQSAVEKDPDFALAWVQLADRYQQEYWWNTDNQEALEKAEAAIERARELQPALPELHLVRANIRYHGYLDYEGALANLELAEQAMPGSADVYEWRGNVLRHMKDFPGALTAYERALQLDPRDLDLIGEYGITLQEIRRYSDAARVFEDAISDFPDKLSFRMARAYVDWYRDADASNLVSTLTRPDFPKGPFRTRTLTYAAWIGGQFEVALAHAHELDELEDDLFHLSPRLMKALILNSAGRTDEAKTLLEQEDQHVLELLSSMPDHFMLLNRGARIAMILGDESRALELAHRAVEIGNSADVVNQLQPAQGDSAVPAVYGNTLCHVGDLEGAIPAFRLVLSDVNDRTLDSLIGQWPPCRDKFVGTSYYEELKEEFGHLSEG